MCRSHHRAAFHRPQGVTPGAEPPPAPEPTLWDHIAYGGRDGRGANLDAPAVPGGTYPARPEWYFLFLFQLLKYFEHLPAHGIEAMRHDIWNPEFDTVDLVHFFSCIQGSVPFCGYVKQRGLPLPGGELREPQIVVELEIAEDPGEVAVGPDDQRAARCDSVQEPGGGDFLRAEVVDYP